MKRYKDKKVKLIVKVQGQLLNYTAKVLEVSEQHITFYDKFGKVYSYLLKDIVEIQTLERVENEKD